MNYKEFFINKRIAVIGLGPHGEMVSDIKFLLRAKASITLYDLRSEKRCRDFIKELDDIGSIRYVLGKIDQDELLSFDLIIISPDISKKSLFLKKAIQAEIQIEFPETLFFKLSPQVTLIGVLGLYGKSSVAYMLYDVLKKGFSEYKDQGLFFIDPDSSNGVLSHLKKIKKGDVVLARIPDSLVSYYHEIHISPHVAVVTSLIPFDILDFQTQNNFIVAPDEVIDAIKSEQDFALRAKMLRTRPSLVPEDWDIETRIVHDKENAALVLQASELFKISQEIVRDVLEDSLGFKGVFSLVKKVAGIEYYNDASSINPKSTLSALKSLSSGKDIVLILGGAYTGHDYTDMLENIAQYVSAIILLPGSGTLGIRSRIEAIGDIDFVQVLSLEDAVEKANEYAKKGNKVLFSPAFEAVGVDISRKERSNRFVKAVRSLNPRK